MSSDSSTLSVEEKRRLTICGFVRGVLDTELPTDIVDVCFMFYHETCEWDSKLHGKKMEIVDDGACVVMEKSGWGTAYLTNEYSRGVHRWQFKIETGPSKGYYFLFGIWKVSSGEPPLEVYFTNRRDNGHAFDAPYSRVTNPQSPGGGGPKYGEEPKAGDMIDMYLDFNILRLTFAFNGVYYPDSVYSIEDCTYKAAVTMHVTNNKIRFISYENGIHAKTPEIIQQDQELMKSKKTGNDTKKESPPWVH